MAACKYCGYENKNPETDEWFDCRLCGVTIPWRGGNHKYCDDCAYTLKRESMQSSKFKLGYLKRDPFLPKMCIECGVSLEDRDPRAIYCYGCAKYRRRTRPGRVKLRNPYTGM